MKHPHRTSPGRSPFDATAGDAKPAHTEPAGTKASTAMAKATPAEGRDNSAAPDCHSSQGTAGAASSARRNGAGGARDALAWQLPAEKPNSAASPVTMLLGVLGHSERCIEQARSGRIATCDCDIRPMEDPAVAVGLALHSARIAMTRGIPIPSTVLELLACRVGEGDPACMMVARWLEGTGLADLWRRPADRSRRLN